LDSALPVGILSSFGSFAETSNFTAERSGGSPSSDRKPQLAAATAGSTHSGPTNSIPIGHHHSPIGSNY
jgi:hypothetical protein